MFKARNQQAWKVLKDHERLSSANPIWYHQALYIAGDLGQTGPELRRLFDEGLRKFPDYFALHHVYMRSMVPRWGGSWESAAKFVAEQVAQKGDEAGDILYARLFWYGDSWDGSSPDFFEKSRVEWPRMRRGFERLMEAYPNGARNHAAFASFACRANDAETYRRLRPNIDRGWFREVAPRGATVEACDARFGSE
jgi:hypothetical protein